MNVLTSALTTVYDTVIEWFLAFLSMTIVGFLDDLAGIEAE